MAFSWPTRYPVEPYSSHLGITAQLSKQTTSIHDQGIDSLCYTQCNPQITISQQMYAHPSPSHEMRITSSIAPRHPTPIANPFPHPSDNDFLSSQLVSYRTVERKGVADEMTKERAVRKAGRRRVVQMPMRVLRQCLRFALYLFHHLH